MPSTPLDLAIHFLRLEYEKAGDWDELAALDAWLKERAALIEEAACAAWE